MLTFRSKSGKHIVTKDGVEHIFNDLHDAWNFIFNSKKA